MSSPTTAVREVELIPVEGFKARKGFDEKQGRSSSQASSRRRACAARVPSVEGTGQTESMGHDECSDLSLSRPVVAESDRDRLQAFLALLAGMSEGERVRASRYQFTSWERHVWAGHYPEDVPLVDGEVEWIALRLVDCE